MHNLQDRPHICAPTSREMEKADEIEAYRTQAAAYRGLGFESTFRIWTRDMGINQQAIDSAAERSTQDWCDNGGNCH